MNYCFYWYIAKKMERPTFHNVPRHSLKCQHRLHRVQGSVCSEQSSQLGHWIRHKQNNTTQEKLLTVSARSGMSRRCCTVQSKIHARDLILSQSLGEFEEIPIKVPCPNGLCEALLGQPNLIWRSRPLVALIGWCRRVCSLGSVRLARRAVNEGGRQQVR